MVKNEICCIKQKNINNFLSEAIFEVNALAIFHFWVDTLSQLSLSKVQMSSFVDERKRERREGERERKCGLLKTHNSCHDLMLFSLYLNMISFDAFETLLYCLICTPAPVHTICKFLGIV
jgi:hypothetical protein